MRKISSDWAATEKCLLRNLCFAWFGLLTCGFVVQIVVKRDIAQMPWLLLLALLGAVAYLFERKLLMELADEVYIEGSDLVVRKDGIEDRFELVRVCNVRGTIGTRNRPERIILSLSDPCKFGDEVAFWPIPQFYIQGTRFWDFAPHPFIKELKDLADENRSERECVISKSRFQ